LVHAPAHTIVAREAMSSREPQTPSEPDRSSEVAFGGADAVEKTTYVVGEGTDPEARPTGPYVARDAAGTGSIAIWIVAGLAALIALVYVIGIFR
jgi:hypothetical protein